MTPCLVTIPFSHYCEKARWALERRGIDFVEEAHLPVLHLRATIRSGGRSTPLLRTGDGPVLADSTDILQWADAHGRQGDVLFPDEEARALEARFDDVLGPHARRLAYGRLFDHEPAFAALLAAAPVPALEHRLAGAGRPLMRWLLRRALTITPSGVERSAARVQQVFAEVERHLADGRPFLAGDRFTAADLTFASLAAPLVMPAAYERRLIPLQATGPAFRAAVDGWRRTRAGTFALRLYESER